ncbi:hypothetical protein VQ03_00250 [Methylobacterium tarhaniae]|uniref:Uncharacterized protein n=1 Tax=Methylobacterium tarhaniae TaxID=1187852 RepID=A0A0J6TGY9_9HYPH|nr:hypothetical protein VQ03_00250 [Methylobacterium tarhaniae]
MSILVCPSSSQTQCVALSFENGQVSLKLLDRGVQLAGIDSQLHALLLRLGEGEPQLGVLDSEGEQIGFNTHAWFALARIGSSRIVEGSGDYGRSGHSRRSRRFGKPLFGSRLKSTKRG